MARSKDSYVINVHYPETEENIRELRKKMGMVYIQFVKDYIQSLPVSETEKTKIYEKTCEYLINYAKDK